MCSFMRNVSRWTGFPACWVIPLKSAPINFKLMNDHFSVSLLVDTTCSHNWIVGGGGWFLKGDHITYSRTFAVALRGNAWGIATFLYSSGGFLYAQHAWGLVVWSAHIQFPADLHCLVIQSLSPLLHCQVVCFFLDIFWFLLTCYSKTQPMSQECKWEASSQKATGCPSIFSDLPRRHYSSIENDQIASSWVGDEKRVS